MLFLISAHDVYMTNVARSVQKCSIPLVTILYTIYMNKMKTKNNKIPHSKNSSKNQMEHS